MKEIKLLKICLNLLEMFEIIGPYLLSGGITFLVLYFRWENVRKHKDAQQVKRVVYENKTKIGEMVIQDKANAAAFKVYQTTMAEKDDQFMELLLEIKGELKSLNSSFVDLKLEVERIKK